MSELIQVIEDLVIVDECQPSLYELAPGFEDFCPQPLVEPSELLKWL